ncbi:2-oxoglutarate dehydrogenase E1 component [Iodidimonas sp. SYSU 1G8]|uniref:2-oxoglutarate dehydrogenase E1 component n=1 Tax=Iodidimonas sp. SYSU 1G8 TaxID=3133967 RepID=UPI0031FEB857
MDLNPELSAILNGANAPFLETLYHRYERDPGSVDPEWRAWFDSLSTGAATSVKRDDGPSWQRSDWPPPANGDMTAALDPGAPSPAKAAPKGQPVGQKEVRAATIDSLRALMLIRAYRVRGHLHAKLDPLGLAVSPDHPELDPESYGFKEADLDRPIYLDNVLGLEMATLREIVELLERTYCGTIGVEYMHISEPEEKAWIQERMEGRDKYVSFTDMGKQAILQKVIEAESFEQFLNVKYTGTKRFGLDGGEATIPALEAIIKRAGALGVKEIAIGMPHRGRLNVLANVMQKPYRAIFNEFRGGSSTPDEVEGSGDVKYHLGSSADREFDGNTVHLSLSANPSHLEAVDPVVMGKVRAKQDQRGDTSRSEVMGLLLHGDAAFAGQGLVPECLGLSQLKGYRTGGTIHFIVNNQIGFTTSPMYSRSSPYPSDIAKGIQAPIFHVNGDDPEAVVHVSKIATEFRQRFKKDVVIDMFCYRRFGHNETDEPMFTQPLMYQRIKSQQSVTQIYARRLAEEGLVDDEEAKRMRDEFRAMLEMEFEVAESFKPNKADWLEGRWAGLKRARGTVRRGRTAEDVNTLRRLIETLTTAPPGFTVHRTLQRQLDRKRETLESGTGIDWATAEALAFGSLLDEGFGVRLSGQDSGRGTFSQRHAVFTDQVTGERYTPLDTLKEDSKFEVIDSMLSEAAVMGFEYGYTLAEPNTLVLWEAQFGDFANGAQVIIDQFLAAGELKWLRMSGLVLLLPHGFEGQGPEHSSARLERYLQMSAEDNWQVANCTTPANYFHILRRQMHREFRKPLILMTPKSLLRHKLCVSHLSDMARGTSFHRIMWDHAQTEKTGFIKLKPDDEISRVVICSGKVYYDLLEERDAKGLNDVYLLRVEQLYPFPGDSLAEEIERFPRAKIVWCQEEPQNMGAWTFVEPFIEKTLEDLDHFVKRPVYVGRPAAASPATGLLARHQAQQAKLVHDALLG